MTDAEVIVVGGGHNGLICAAYLARAGIDTLLVESRDSVGGCASTVSDLGARFNICHCDHSMVRAMPVIDELELEAFGLEYLEPDVSAVHLFHDDSEPWLFFHEIDRTLDSIAGTYPRQLDGYRRYLEAAMPAAAFAIEMARNHPTGPSLMRAALARRARGAVTLLDWSRRSASDVLSRYFDDWRLVMPAVSSGPTVWGVSPDAPGTGLGAATYASKHLVRTGRPRGGSGALTDSTRASFEAAGGRVRCGARVTDLLVGDGSVRGLRLDDESELHSPVVVAACDPHRVFVEWISEPPPAARKLVQRWRNRPSADGYESKIDAVLTSLPGLRATDRLRQSFPGVDLLGPSSLVLPSPDQLAEAHRLRADGRVAAFPTMLLNVPSVLDPDMRPGPDRHVLSIEVLFTPYALRGGWSGSAEPQRWLDMWGSLMEPGALAAVDRWRAMTPDRYEREFSMHRGHTPSYGGSPLATLVGRRPELSRYRTPIGGLYLSGAGTFPGAGIFGASGRNAAHVVRRDLRHRLTRRFGTLRRTAACSTPRVTT
ncbi:MAG: NAD(P)/FAD-dependent oxidoreductase [Acidimicrobiia bacterium]|nr:NAD(P)/FAD-dependent oxidoreductase [Acidimicrobiia bacterium]